MRCRFLGCADDVLAGLPRTQRVRGREHRQLDIAVELGPGEEAIQLRRRLIAEVLRQRLVGPGFGVGVVELLHEFDGARGLFEHFAVGAPWARRAAREGGAPEGGDVAAVALGRLGQIWGRGEELGAELQAGTHGSGGFGLLDIGRRLRRRDCRR